MNASWRLIEFSLYASSSAYILQRIYPLALYPHLPTQMALANGHDLVREHYPEARRGQVIDIGDSQLTESLRGNRRKKLVGTESQSSHSLSDSFFSNNKGLAIWKITNELPNYYQTDHEVELLDIRKVAAPLLDRLEAAGKKVQYDALDLSRSAIEQNLAAYSSTYQHVTSLGLWCTFEDGLGVVAVSESSSCLHRSRIYLRERSFRARREVSVELGARITSS
ncbi:uncharacterized protein LY89DRAFT_742696 [Mollisia scopiformis]|uniref:Histidine-specific methyltransferase SAM-dependent domain-containing protein n=1 Tax=Mollisia scopiformis TaxID=149040 RepID=A0A132B6E8_MOLSC|nr:uncharacterized protein LY89DRAFT_742696 [Mollisia scopiformis]KUJ07464.1 hypothetical protein LY89DRAFT_742696 [Mollisia scopiformis]